MATGPSKTAVTTSSIGTYDEDRCRIRTGHGPENITRLRRFAIGVIKSKGARSVAQKMRQLNKSTRLVFDYLRMTNSPARTALLDMKNGEQITVCLAIETTNA